MTHKIITLTEQGEERPSIAAEVDAHDERWNGYLIPLLTFDQLLGLWVRLEENDHGNGEWRPHPRLEDDGLVLVIEGISGEPMHYLAETDGRFRIDGMQWVEGDIEGLAVLPPPEPTLEARFARDEELGRRLLAVHGDELCMSGYATIEPEWVGRYGRGYGDIEVDGTLT